MDKAAAAVWGDPDTFATCLLALGLDRYGSGGQPAHESPVHWAPSVWIDEIRDDTGVELPQRNLDRLMAACALVTNPDSFHHSSKSFSTITSAISAAWFNPDVWHPPTVDETLWTLIETHLLYPPDDQDAPYGSEVVRYINMIVRNEGFRKMPQAFVSFGVADDPAVWSKHAAIDYSSDPDLNAAVEDATDMRESNLDLDIADRVMDLATRIAKLPVKGDVIGVGRELASYAESLRGAGMDLPTDG